MNGSAPSFKGRPASRPRKSAIGFCRRSFVGDAPSHDDVSLMVLRRVNHA
jgi:hypothetical protein